MSVIYQGGLRSKSLLVYTHVDKEVLTIHKQQQHHNMKMRAATTINAINQPANPSSSSSFFAGSTKITSVIYTIHILKILQDVVSYSLISIRSCSCTT